MRLPIRQQGRIAHQVPQFLAQVARVLQAKVGLRHAVAPLDLALLVQQNHPIGAGMKGMQHALHTHIGSLHRFFFGLQPAPGRGPQHRPQPPQRRQIGHAARLQPAPQFMGLPAIGPQPQPTAHQHGHQGTGPPGQPAAQAANSCLRQQQQQPALPQHAHHRSALRR